MRVARLPRRYDRREGPRLPRPFFSLRPESLWAVDSLVRLGLVYDSSVHPTAGRSTATGARRACRTPQRAARVPDHDLRPVRRRCRSAGAVLPPAAVPGHPGRPAARLNARGRRRQHLLPPEEFDPDLPRLKVGAKMNLIVAGVRTLEAKFEPPAAGLRLRPDEGASMNPAHPQQSQRQQQDYFHRVAEEFNSHYDEEGVLHRRRRPRLPPGHGAAVRPHHEEDGLGRPPPARRRLRPGPLHGNAHQEPRAAGAVGLDFAGMIEVARANLSKWNAPTSAPSCRATS